MTLPVFNLLVCWARICKQCISLNFQLGKNLYIIYFCFDLQNDDKQNQIKATEVYFLWTFFKKHFQAIVARHPPPPFPLIKFGGVRPSKNWVLLGGGVQNFLLERGNKTGKRALMQKWGCCHFFYNLQFSSIPFIVCGGKVRFPLLLFGSSLF